MSKAYDIAPDETLMKLVQKGDKQAFHEIYRRYSTPLLQFMFRLVNRNEALAQDKLHDIFLRIIEYPNKFDTSRKFRPWIYTIAANECKKHFRNAQKVSDSDIQTLEIQDGSDILQHLELADFTQSLHTHLEKLSYPHQTVFALRFIEKFSIKEISQIMKCPSGTVKSRIHYVLKTLSKKLTPHKPE